ncbi:potassium voltage-gated channel subfamily G member 2 [Tachyglossus aculeatus]|uniref:potassium voltage-gated channel subfamily G member 2 n=1 Tax=Tachyglossus aculeatus TaxID=9261 RepID=UPI0018F6AB7C|nr:potassium voltage-gated channel subfamily G member 2 [Tachyglossus aculeatus]
MALPPGSEGRGSGPGPSAAAEGSFYRQARLLRPGEAPARPRRREGRARHVVINVGGVRYSLPWASLARCPLGRLERLRACRSHDDIMRVCDDYEAGGNEFFFDRNPCAFRTLMSFLAAGKLRLLREACALAFRDELDYWGVEEERLERCCLHRLRRCQREEEEEEEQEREEAAEGARCGGSEPSPPWAGPAQGRLQRCLQRLGAAVEDPRSGLPGQLFACVSVSFVAVTAVGLCMSTLPDVRAEEERGECSQRCHNIFVLETVCVAWFSLEFLLRSLQAESKCAFLRTPLNLLDMVALLPFYVSLLVDLASGGPRPGPPPGGGGNKSLERVGLVLRFLRALRILYVMRLARHSLGLQTLGLTVRRCAREFGLLLLFLCVAMALFSPLVFLAESELGARQDFTSVPSSYWWAVISMTTVGYGDMVPRSLPGQVVALSSILSGILLMAFPVTSIFHTFSRSYAELRDRQRRRGRRWWRAGGPDPPALEDSTRSHTDDSFPGPDGPFPPGAGGAADL